MAENKKPEEQIKEAAWKFSGMAILVISVFLAGVGLAWTQWGDAPSLRERLEEMEGRLSGARTEKENTQHQVGRLQRQIESIQAELDACKNAATAASEPAEPTT